MSRSLRNITALFTLIALSTSIGLASDSAAQAATDRYLEYRALVPEAEALEDLVPYHAEWWGKRKLKQSAEEKQITVAREKENVAKNDNVVVVEAQGSEKKVVIHLSASWQDLPMRGKVSMAFEDGSWRIDEEVWVTAE